MNKLTSRGKWFVFGTALAVLLLAGIGILAVPRLLGPAVSYPTQGWQSSTPEEQGFDSAKLAEGLAAIQKNGTRIHSLMMVRHGAVILDATFYPYDGSLYHDTASVTKSVMTTLIGIAVDQGQLDLDAPFVSYFPGRSIANLDAQKERITLRHLVSNTSGLDCTAAGDEKTLQDMQASPDWVQFVLDLKAVGEPGASFEYCSPGMHLLSAILQEATGMTALEYAQANLFKPLGIEDVYWLTDPQGIPNGAGDLSMHPHDMAKLGYLFLHNGVWEGRQIVSRDWVSQATTWKTKTGRADDYGYGWWVSLPDSDIEFYIADGRGGQRIHVVPSMDLVLVTTGGGYEFPEIEDYIVAAIADLENPLPANPDGVERLKEVVARLALPPAAQTVPPLPATAQAISGQVFILDPNPIGVQWVRLDFDAPAEATFYLELASEDAPRQSAIGLDGIYRPSRSGRPVMARGRWIEENIFLLEYSEGPGLNHYVIQLRFDGGNLVFDFSVPDQPEKVSIAGHIEN